MKFVLEVDLDGIHRYSDNLKALVLETVERVIKTIPDGADMHGPVRALPANLPFAMLSEMREEVGGPSFARVFLTARDFDTTNWAAQMTHVGNVEGFVVAERTAVEFK